MIQPEELKHDKPLVWSNGRGTDVWAMFCACVAGDLAAVEKLTGKDHAAKFGQKAMVELLLRHGTSPNLAEDPSWATPLSGANRRGQAEIADLLKRHGAT